MKTSYKLAIIVLLAGLVGLAACGTGEEETQSPLAQAMAMAPADTAWFFFTDWALIKEYEGFQDISSGASMETKVEFLMFGADPRAGQPMRQAPASAYGLQYLRNHAEVWGWDTTDLVWEATLEIDGPPLYVLQFPQDFDLGPFLALLEEREFATSEYRGVTVYSHEQDLEADWLRQTGAFAILNTGVLEQEKILVLSASADNVLAVLDTHEGDAAALADDSAAAAVTDRMGQVAAAVVGSGAKVCADLNLAGMLGPQSTSEQLEKLTEELGLDKPLSDQDRIHPYLAFGTGYRYEEETPVGLVVWHYASEAFAEADRELRRRLVEEWSSLITREPYDETLFGIKEASVEDTDLVWRVHPINDIPRRLFDMVFQRDLLFALCP